MALKNVQILKYVLKIMLQTKYEKQNNIFRITYLEKYINNLECFVRALIVSDLKFLEILLSPFLLAMTEIFLLVVVFTDTSPTSQAEGGSVNTTKLER